MVGDEGEGNAGELPRVLCLLERLSDDLERFAMAVTLDSDNGIASGTRHHLGPGEVNRTRSGR